MRPAGAALAVAAALALAGCGDSSERDLGAELGYLPPDTGLAVVLSTDLDGEQWQALEAALFAGPLAEASLGSADQAPPDDLDELLEQILQLEGIGYHDDIRPLLGDDLVVGLAGDTAIGPIEGIIAILDTGDGGAAERLLESAGLERKDERAGAELWGQPDLPAPYVAIDGDLLIAALDSEGPFDAERNPILDEALDRAADGAGLTAEALEAAGAGLDPAALVRGFADLGGILDRPEIDRARSLPWIDALRDVGFAASLPEDGTLRLEANLNTDPEGLEPEDLPFPLGAPAPDLVRLEGEIAGASADQSRTTTFLLELARAAFPRSRFVSDVAKLERALELDFSREVLEAFDRPSASSVSLDGGFAARSEVRDPRRFVRLMRRLAPDLGRVVQDLQALRTQGLIALFLVAPDAPIAPRVLGESRIEVRRLRGDGDLYEISNLRPPDAQLIAPVPDRLVFGLVDDVFVVASDERRAAEIAAAPTEEPPTGAAASVAAGDLSELRGELEEALGFDPGPVGELTAALIIDQFRLQGELTLELGP